MNDALTLPKIDSGVFEMVQASGPVVQSVLIVLIILSVLTWALTISKIFQLKRAKRDTKEFSDLFWESRDFERIDDSSKRLKGSPLAAMFDAGYRELVHIARRAKEDTGDSVDSDTELKIIDSAIRRAEFTEVVELNRGTTFLATVATAAPFLGLFGTVWGIMTAFHGLSQAKSATIQAVAPGISEALVATAIGLAAAIPASIAFNYFTVMIRNMRYDMDKFRNEFVRLAGRYFHT